jgi:hypothetical protein
MATISFGADGAARTVTQDSGTGTVPGALDPHMVKCVVGTGKFFRVVPPYACDTWEIVMSAAGNTTIRIFGLDNDYDGSGAPNADEKYEVPDTTPEYNSGFKVDGLADGQADLPRSIIWDQAWKALQFDVTTGPATIKVKAYRSGQSTFEGNYTTVTNEDS